VEGIEDEDADAADENVVKAEMKRLYRHTKRDAQRLFQRAHRSFNHFFYRD
jgi:hypothetical protein